MIKRLMIFTAVGITFASPVLANTSFNELQRDAREQQGRQLALGETESTQNYNGSSLRCQNRDKVYRSSGSNQRVATGDNGAGTAL